MTPYILLKLILVPWAHQKYNQGPVECFLQGHLLTFLHPTPSDPGKLDSLLQGHLCISKKD